MTGSMKVNDAGRGQIMTPVRVVVLIGWLGFTAAALCVIFTGHPILSFMAWLVFQGVTAQVYRRVRPDYETTRQDADG